MVTYRLSYFKQNHHAYGLGNFVFVITFLATRFR